MEPELELVYAATSDFELLSLGTVDLELMAAVATVEFSLVQPGTIDLELIAWQ
jgi:hypothetical protein